MTCDVLILGSGAAGLALAARLATASTTSPAGGSAGRQVILVDQVDTPVAGRVWAFWSARQTPLDDAVSHSWAKLVVVADGRQLELRPHPYTYHLMRGEDLQTHVDRLLERAGGFTRLTGTVHRVDDAPDLATVLVGEIEVRARWVLDSRPPPVPPLSHARLGDQPLPCHQPHPRDQPHLCHQPHPGDQPHLCHQPHLCFLGWEIASPGAGFDPTCATFMDFRAGVPGEVRFCYALPTHRDRALVEIAAFACGTRTPPDLAAGLASYLREVCELPSWQVRRQEAGELPLHAQGPRRTGRRVMRVGLAGGMLKPSTGYAFDRIIRDADAVVGSLDRFGHPWALPRPRRRHAWLDGVLLDLVATEPAAVEPAFARMFARNPARRVLRFLDEDTRLVEELLLIASLPPVPFLRAALR
jgi:lycopene beta-cyclase